MQLLSDHVLPDSSSNISFVLWADVKCGLYEINKNNSANAAQGISLVQKMFLARTEATSDCVLYR